MAVDKALLWLIGRPASESLTLRSLSVLLAVGMKDVGDDAITVRGLSEKLAVSKPAITRACDALNELGLIRRDRDPRDARSVLIRPTKAGQMMRSDFLRIAAA